VVVIVEPSRLALTNTPSMRPSSWELICPVNATSAELAAPTKLDGAQNNIVTAAPAMAIARKVFFNIGHLLKSTRDLP